MTALSDGHSDRDNSIWASSLMARAVDDVRIPSDMLDRAARGNRKRTVHHRRLGIVGAVAAVSTASAVVFALPGGTTARQPAAQQPAAQPPAISKAFVLARVTEAQANTRTMISVAHASYGTFYTDVATQEQRYDAGILASNGQPYFQWVDTVNNGTWTETMIVNQDRVYSVQTTSANANLAIAPHLPLQGKSNPMAAFNTALKQGLVKVVGHRELDGRDTILLRYTNPASRMMCGAASAAICAKKKAARVTIPPRPDGQVWIDARTYLVVQIQDYVFRVAGPRNSAKWSPDVTTVKWLPATSGNLALLSLTPPPGYARVPETEMGKYLGPVS